MVAAGLGLGAMGADGWFLVPENHVAIMESSFAGLKPSCFAPGLHLKTPFISRTHDIYVGSAEKDITPIKIVSDDGKSIEASFRITSSMSTEKLVENYKVMGTTELRDLILVSCVNHAWANETRVGKEFFARLTS